MKPLQLSGHWRHRQSPPDLKDSSTQLTVNSRFDQHWEVGDDDHADATHAERMDHRDPRQIEERA
jgi:hypothetical protein